jgi:hypothetical protein
MALTFVDKPEDNYSPDQVAGLNLGGLYQQADKALGGWLPGGGTANPLSKPLRQAVQVLTTAPVATVKPPDRPFKPIKGATRDTPAVDQRGNLTKEGKEVLAQLGITANVTGNMSETNPLAQIGAKLSPIYAGAAHANPFENEIYIPPAGGLNNLAVLAHEAGHLDKSRRKGNRPPLEGVLGQAINMPAAALKQATGGDLSPFAQLLAPLRILGGGVTAYSDAHEEDYAEKYTQSAMRSMVGDSSGRGGIANAGTATTASGYSQGLYSTGMDSAVEGVVDLAIPTPVKVLGAVVDQAAKALKPKEKAGPALNPTASKQKLQMLLVEADVDLKVEAKQNPNSRLLPRLKQIRDGYAAQLAALE